MKKIILIIIMLIINLNFLYSQDVKKIIFKPSEGSTLTGNDVKEILDANIFNRDMRFECVIDNSVTKITKYTFKDERCKNQMIQLTIPSNWISIPDDAFNDINAKAVEFAPNSQLKKIGKKAFNGCAITKIEIPSSVEEIEEDAFSSCHKLEEVEFAPNSQLKKIGKKAFYNCRITKIVIPSSVEEIEEYAFDTYAFNEDKHKNLEEVEFAANSQIKKIGERAFRNSNIKNIVIPSSVEEIGKGAFEDCYKLEAIEFSSNSQLKKIGESAFQISNITKIVIPSSVEEIGGRAFASRHLESVEFAPNSKLKKLDGFSTTGIKFISIPSSVEEIGNSAFTGCAGLEEIYFATNSKLKYLSGFGGTGIKNITIPSSVEEIGRGAFYDYDYGTKLESVEFAPNSKLKKIEGGAFGRCKKIKNITIPSSVEEIGGDAFSDCKNLESVEFAPNSKLKKIEGGAFITTQIKEITFPKSLKSIGVRILNYDSYVNKITFKSSVPPVFEYDPSGLHTPRFISFIYYFRTRQPLTIKVPKGSKKKYKSALDIIIQEQIIDYFKRDLNRTYFSDREAAVLYDLIKIVE